MQQTPTLHKRAAGPALAEDGVVIVFAGDQLDAAFTTLRMLNKRLAALSAMAHEPTSCCNATGVNVNAQVWFD